MTNLELADALQAEFPGYEVVDVVAAVLRNLHTENTALRVMEDNLRQELQECQDQRRAAFRRIEELEALRAQIGQGVPDGWQLVPKEPTLEMWKAVNKLDDQCAEGNYDGKGCSIEQAWDCLLASAPAAPQVAAVLQKPLTDEQINQMWSDAHNDTSTMSLIHVLARAIEAAHRIGEKK